MPTSPQQAMVKQAVLKMTAKERAAGWGVFWVLTGYFIGYEASAFANGIPREYDLMHALMVGIILFLLAVLMRSRST